MEQQSGRTQGLTFEKIYTLHKGWKIFLYIVTAAMFAGGIYLIYDGILEKNWLFTVLGIFLIAIALSGYLDAQAGKIIITNYGITREGIFGRKELLLNDIKGYQVVKGRRISLYPVSKLNKVITIGDYSYFTDGDEILTWVALNCKDLDAEQEQIGIEEIQNDESYGYNSEERLAELEKLKRFCSYFNYGGIGLCFWMFIHPEPYDYAVLAGTIWPLVVMFVFCLKRDTVTLNSKDNKKQAVYPSLSTALILPPIGLLVRALIDFKLVHVTDTLFPASIIIVVLGAVFVGILMNAKEKARSNKTTWLNAAVFVLLYSFTAPTLINCNFDYNKPKIYTAQVLSQRVSKGKHTSYDLTLSKWGARESKETEVSKSLYYQVKVGDTVYVNLKPGLFKMAWFYVSK